MTNVKSTEPLLELRGLNMNIGAVKPIRDVSLTLYQGETHAIVGESGCGKSMTALSLMGLQPTQATISAEHWKFGGKLVAYQSEKDWRQLRRNDIAMIFQNPMSSLNPTIRIGTQIAEVLLAKSGVSRATAKQKAIELLEATQIRQPEVRARQYPFELSGGMLQRAMIAMAMACKPRLLIADEPTTALDATVQAEVLSLLKQLQQETGMAMLLITHDLGVVAQVADKVSVMYAGEIIEQASVKQLFQATAHPYTAALKAAVPSLAHNADTPLMSIEGQPPDLRLAINGCGFADRCPSVMNCCAQKPPSLTMTDGHTVSCWLQHKDCPKSARFPA